MRWRLRWRNEVDAHAMGWRSDDFVACMGVRWRFPEVGNDRGGAVPVPVAIGGGVFLIFLKGWPSAEHCFECRVSSIIALLRAEPGVATVWTCWATLR